MMNFQSDQVIDIVFLILMFSTLVSLYLYMIYVITGLCALSLAKIAVWKVTCKNASDGIFELLKIDSDSPDASYTDLVLLIRDKYIYRESNEIKRKHNLAKIAEKFGYLYCTGDTVGEPKPDDSEFGTGQLVYKIGYDLSNKGKYASLHTNDQIKFHWEVSRARLNYYFWLTVTFGTHSIIIPLAVSIISLMLGFIIAKYEIFEFFIKLFYNN